jgi:hypothetical protein
VIKASWHSALPLHQRLKVVNLPPNRKKQWLKLTHNWYVSANFTLFEKKWG